MISGRLRTIVLLCMGNHISGRDLVPGSFRFFFDLVTFLYISEHTVFFDFIIDRRRGKET